MPDEELVRKKGRVLALTRLAVVMVIFLFIIVLASAAITSILAYKQAHEAVKQSEDNGSAVDILNDCLIEGGKCFAQQQKNQSDIIGIPKGPINTVFVLSLSCNMTLDVVPDETPESRAKRINMCVAAILEETDS